MLDIIKAIAADPSIHLSAPETVYGNDWPRNHEAIRRFLLGHAGYLRSYGEAAYVRMGLPAHLRPAKTPDHELLAARVAACPLSMSQIAKHLGINRGQLAAWLDVAKGGNPLELSPGRVPIYEFVMEKVETLPVGAPAQADNPDMVAATPSVHEIVKLMRDSGFSRTVFADAIGVNRSTLLAWIQLADGHNVRRTDRSRALPSAHHMAKAAEIARKAAR